MNKRLGAFAAAMGLLAVVSVGAWWGLRNPTPAPGAADLLDPDTKTLILDLSTVRTGAIIDFSRAPIGTLFETKLLGSKKLTWVERAQVDKVIAELELQALFSPAGTGERAGLGKLLKADLFILLRSGESPGGTKIKHLEIAVCESRYGLRLATRAVPLTEDTDASIKALEGVLDGALARLSDKITDVCAVPPFISNDLDYKHDHLKAAYGRVLENHLLQRKGILLIELAEAQAIAKEAALAGDAKVQRWLPLYFLGAFRHEGKGEERRVEFDLKVQRGDQTIGSKEKVPVLPHEAPGQLGKLADELAGKVLVAGAGGALDAPAEIEQLLTRSSAFDRLGNWRESLAMLETALLLDPNQPDVHLRASHAGAMVTLAEMKSAQSGKPEDGVPTLRTYRRAMEHLEMSHKALVKRDPPLSPPRKIADPGPSMEFMLATFTIKGLKTLKPPSDERTALFNEVMAEERERYLRMARLRARFGTGDEHRFLRWATESLPHSERFPLIRAMILELKDLPHAKDRTTTFAHQVWVDLNDPNGLALAQELAKHAQTELKAAGEALLKNHDEALVRSKEKPPAPKARPLSAELRLAPIELTHRELGRANIQRISQWLSAGPNLDFFFSGSVVYLMKDKGIIDGIWSTSELNVRPHRMSYDGRYLWFSVNRSGRPSLLVVADPKTLKTWEFTAGDGLPLSEAEGPADKSKTHDMDMAPLGPGRVCVVGSFGRTWIGIATFDPERGKSVQIFHEAREAVEAKLGELWPRTHLAFNPFCAHVLEGPDGARRVLIGRHANDYTAGVQQHPLLVDPDKRTVEVSKEKMSLQGRPGQVRDGGVYYVGAGAAPKTIDLFKVEFPGVRKRILTDVPQGWWRVLVDDDLHIVTTDKDWWHGSVKGKGMRYLGTLGDGQLDLVGLSSHYGLVILYQARLHQVLFRSDGAVVRTDTLPNKPKDPAPILKNESPKNVKDLSPLAQADLRLNAMIAYHILNHGSLDEVFELFTRMTKVRFRLADPPKAGKVMAIDGFRGFGTIAANMTGIAEHSFTDGRWEKDGDGYVLVGKPKVVWTPKDFADAAARQKAAKEANDTLKNDERLTVRVKFNFNGDPSLDDLLEVLRTATKLTIRLNDPPKEGKALGLAAGGDLAVWKLMQTIADRTVFDGKWEKDGDGYRLTGRPRRVVTQQEEAEAAARKKAFDETVARAKALSLRGETKLQAKLTVKEVNPKLRDLLKRLEEATGVGFKLADHLGMHEPTFGGVQFPDVPAWMVMDLIARTDIEKGAWIKTTDGYRLEGVSISSRPAPKNRLEAERMWHTLADSPDTREHLRLVRGLAAAPDVTLPLIKDRLHPVKGPDQKQFTEFRGRLHSSDSAVSEAARKELLTMDLNEGTFGILDLAAANDLRLKKVLIEVKARVDKATPRSERLRAANAVKVLERIGTPEARQQLEALAAGAYAAALTNEARAAIHRLQKDGGER